MTQRLWSTWGRVRQQISISLALGILLFTSIFATLAQSGIGFTPTVYAHGGTSTSTGVPNRFNAASQTSSVIHPWFGKGTSANTPAGAPQHISRGGPPHMTPGTLTLIAGKATSFVGSDGRFEIDVPQDAITAADAQAAGGAVRLQITEIAPASGSNAGGSDLVSFGEYLVQVVDAHGVLTKQGLRKPVTLKMHYGTRDTALDLTHAFVVFNGSLPVGVTSAPTSIGLSSISRHSLHDTDPLGPGQGTPITNPTPQQIGLGATSTQNVTVDSKARTMTVHPLIGSPSTSMTWNTDSAVSSFGKPDPFNVDLSAGSLTADYPLELPAGPGGFTPPVTLSYSSAGVSENHSPQAAASWVGEGWNLSLGSITWAEHNVTSSCQSTCGSTWEDSWQISDPYGTSSELIPPNINVATYYDDSAFSITPSPVQWHTAPETHAKIYSYVGPVNPPDSGGVHTPCFRVFLENGVMEEFGCTTDSLEYYYTPGNGDYVSSWNLDLITDPHGNQIHLTYYQDATTVSGRPSIRDAQLSTIEYDSPNCLNAQTMCTGSSWAPLMRVDFFATHGGNAVYLTNTPTGCNTDAGMRCDDPKDLSGSGGLATPSAQSTFILNDIQIQARGSTSESWHMLRDYQLAYQQNGPPTTPITDPSTGKAESTAGQLLLTSLAEFGDDGATQQPKRVYGYSQVTQYYEDDLFHPNPATNCGPSWNTGNGSGCILWSQSYDGNSWYISSVANGMGLAQTFTWDNARNNTHGVNGGGSNTALALYCNGHQTGYPCNEADDENWSHAVLTQQQGDVLRPTLAGNLHVTTTTAYAYSLTYPLAAQECPDCVAGMYWGNQNDGDYLDYYNAKFMGFAETDVNNPDGSIIKHKYLATEGYGVYDTNQVGCYSNFGASCHNAPWWDLTNVAHGHEYETDSYDTNGTTLLSQSKTQYQAVCPSSGVSGTPPWTGTPNYGNWNGNLVSELDHNNPVAVCDVLATQSYDSTYDGASLGSTVPTVATINSYDSYGRLTTTSRRANDTPGLLRFEAETMPVVSHSAPVVTVNTCCGVLWSGGAELLLQSLAAGQQVTLSFSVPTSGVYDVSELMTQSSDNGISALAIDGTQIGQPFDGYFSRAVAAQPFGEGQVSLGAGSHTATWSVTGKNSASANYSISIDALELRPVASSPSTILDNTAYIWNDAVSATGTGATGTYLINFPAQTYTQDPDNTLHTMCSVTAYDGNNFGTGQQGGLTVGAVTLKDVNTSNGTNQNGYACTNHLRTTYVYDSYGNFGGSADGDANAGVSSHLGCTVGSTSYSDCAAYAGPYYTEQQDSANALGQTTATGHGSTTDPAGGFGLWTTFTADKNGQQTAYGYDPLGRMTSRTLPGETNAPSSTWTYTDWCSGTSAQTPCLEIDQTQRRDSSTTVTSRAFYDGWGNLVETRDPGPSGFDVVQYTEYDPSLRVAAESVAYFMAAYTGAPGKAAFSIPNPNQTTSTKTYDGADRVTSVTDTLSHVSTTAYDVACGQFGDSSCYSRVNATDPLGHRQRTYTDALGRQIYDERDSGNSPGAYAVYATTTMTYDYNGNEVQILSPDGVTKVTFSYDGASRKIGMTDPDRGTETYTLDADGNRISSVDARGGAAGTVWAGYDGIDRQIWRNTTNSPTGAYTTYTYDTAGTYGKGHLASETFTGGPNRTLSGNYTYGYDQRGNQISMTETVGGHVFTVLSTYDDASDVLAQTYPTGETISNGYTSQGWLTSVTDVNGTTSTNVLSNGSYSGIGGASHLLTSAGLGNSAYTYNATYDNLLRLTDAKLTRVSDSATLFEETRGFDASGNVSALNTTLPAGTDHQTFCYDEQDRLTWAGSTGTAPCGNSPTPGTLTSAQYTQNYGYDILGRLTSGTLGSYTYGDPAHVHGATSIGSQYTASYDASGNMTCRAPSNTATCSGQTPTGAQLSYDNEGSLVAWQNTPTSPTTSDAFLYDGEGNRVEQQVTTGGTTPTTTSTIYVGNLEEWANNGTSTTTTTYYYAGEQRIALAITGGNGTPAFSYLATDALGSATLAADAQGNVQATQLYAPYGGVRYSSGNMPTDYGFTGQHSDTTTGLDYYGARYYDPLAGQFTSADSVLPGDDPWSLSRYAYVASNPLIRLDPTGHCWVVCAIVHTITHAVKAAVKVVAAVADTTLGISSMISDVKIIFSGKTNFFQKVLAVGDLSLNAFMDVTTVVGVGEGLRAGYLGVKVAGKVGLRALGKFAVHDGEDAVGHVIEHEVADVAERDAEEGAAQEAEHVGACAESFAASTPVSTPQGLRAIASLKAGDAVTAYDPTTGKASVQTVQQTMIHHDTNLLAVTLRTVATVPAKSAAVGSGKQQMAAVASHGAHAPPTATATTDETIQTTSNHPWLTADHGWILASFLRVGEPVRRVDGATAIVVALQAEPGAAAMWDLTVSQVHTFAVGAGAYVVHNSDCGPRAKGLMNALRKSGAEVDHTVVGVGRAADGTYLVSLNERVAEEGVTDLTDQTARAMQDILERPGWARQGMRYVGPTELRPFGTGFDTLMHAEDYLLDAGGLPDSVRVSLRSGPCARCLARLAGG